MFIYIVSIEYNLDNNLFLYIAFYQLNQLYHHGLVVGPNFFYANHFWSNHIFIQLNFIIIKLIVYLTKVSIIQIKFTTCLIQEIPQALTLVSKGVLLINPEGLQLNLHLFHMVLDQIPLFIISIRSYLINSCSPPTLLQYSEPMLWVFILYPFLYFFYQLMMTPFFVLSWVKSPSSIFTIRTSLNNFCSLSPLF